MAIINGTAGNDTLTGTASADTINGAAGDDKLDGGLGNDFLFGGLGNDTMTGGDGRDTINGGEGVDYLYGGADNDTFLFSGANALAGWNEVTGGDTIMDFAGQGVNGVGDFIAFTGLGTTAQGASLTYSGTSVHNAQLQYYTVHSSAGVDYVLAVKMAAGAGHLAAGDFAFY